MFTHTAKRWKRPVVHQETNESMRCVYCVHVHTHIQRWCEFNQLSQEQTPPPAMTQTMPGDTWHSAKGDELRQDSHCAMPATEVLRPRSGTETGSGRKQQGTGRGCFSECRVPGQDS